MQSFSCILCSFCISWIFALANLLITFLLYVFISRSQPGLPLGVSSQFSFSYWLVSVCKNTNRYVSFSCYLWSIAYSRQIYLWPFHLCYVNFFVLRKSEKRIVVHSDSVSYGISLLQVTEDNSDYRHRDKKHHSSPFTNPIPY